MSEESLGGGGFKLGKNYESMDSFGSLSKDSASEEEYEQEVATPTDISFNYEIDNHLLTSDLEGVVTEEHLMEINRELGLIRICGGERAKAEYEDLWFKRLHYPQTYKENSRKEKLLLWYAENYRQEFNFKYPNRRPLIIARNNECNVQKMVCTTIRPTNMRFPEFHTWKGCASFVSHYLTYEQLDNPLLLPDTLSSPQTVIRRQSGHSFEFSTVLVSFLIGSGYDAYVVSGYASKEICLQDQSRIECPFLRDETTEVQEEDLTEDPKYFLKKPVELKSRFLDAMKEREIQKQNEAQLAKKLAEINALKEFEKPPQDKLWGWRLHSWVLVLPSKEVLEPFFIEPTTGIGKATDDPEYIGIESLWNNQNYWIFVQFPSKTESCKDIIFDLNNPQYWARLLIGEPISFRQMPPEIMEAETDEFLRKCVEVEKHLDMPKTWVDPIKLSSSEYEARYPRGKKEVYYRKAKHELFSPYAQKDGLLERVTEYADYTWRDPRVVKEIFINRQDRMYYRKKNVIFNSSCEKFKRGREDALKEHFYYSHESGVEATFTFHFYNDARLDGMTTIEMHLDHSDVYFQNRPDRMYLLHVDIEPRITAQHNFRLIRNAIVKYLRDPTKEADDDKAEVIYKVSLKQVLMKFHYEDENLTYAKRTFVKPAFAEKGARIEFDPSLTFGYQTSPIKPPLKPLYLYGLQLDSLRGEDAVLKLVREKKEEVICILRTRAQELASPNLVITEFDIERNGDAKQAFQDREQEKREMEARDLSLECDFLAPYYVKFGIYPKTVVSKRVAKQIVEECLKDWKNLLVARANDIQLQFEEACQEFQEKNDWYEQNQKKITKEEEEAYFEYCKKNSYYLHILEVRLNRHKELAPSRYIAIHNYLRNDPRLASLFSKMQRRRYFN